MAAFRPVKQQFHHDPANGSWGDCFRACIASLLGLSLSSVPHFMDRGVTVEAASNASRAWLAGRGLALVEVPMSGDLNAVLHTIEGFNPGLRFMLSGHSRTGCDHCVICQGAEIIHDPSLTDAGIIGPCESSEPPLYWISFLVPTEPHFAPAAPPSLVAADGGPLPIGPGVPRGRVTGAPDDRPGPYAPTAYPPNP